MASISDMITNARMIKGEASRAKSYLMRYEVPKSIDLMISALHAKSEMAIVSADRIDIELMARDYCQEFDRNQYVREVLAQVNFSKPQYLNYSPEKEREVINRLAVIRETMAEIEMGEQAKKQKEHLERREALIAQAEEMIRSGQLPKARVTLKRAAEQFGREPGVLARVGKVLLDAKEIKDAREMFVQAIDLHPKDPDGYAFLVEACQAGEDLPGAEDAYLKAIKQFGEHPQTCLNLAKLYQRMRNRDKAEEFARRAFELDNTLAEAKTIMENAEYGGYDAEERAEREEPHPGPARKPGSGSGGASSGEVFNI